MPTTYSLFSSRSPVRLLGHIKERGYVCVSNPIQVAHYAEASNEIDSVQENMDSANKILERSFDSFKDQQPHGLFEKFQQTQLHDLKIKILEIQTSQERRKSMTDFPRIVSFIVAFEGFVETFRLTPAQTACIWGPVKYVLHVVKDDIKAVDEILQSYRGLGIRLPSVKSYASLVTAKPEVSICLAYMYHDLLEFQKSLLKLFAGHDWKATFHTNWKYYHQDSFPDILKSFDHHRKALDDLLRAHHYQISNEHHQISRDMSLRFNNHLQTYQDDRQDLEAHIRRYEKDRDELLHNAREQETHRKQQQFDAFRKWVSAPRSLQDNLHRSFIDTREEFPGTTDWILKNDNVESWMDKEEFNTSILCITGKKGTGKTVLASRIIDHCDKNCNDFKTSYFYCREDDPSQNNCLAIYKSLLIQMLRHYPDLLPSCHERRLRGNEMLNDEAVAQALIKLFCNADMSQFIIIDGVDEIDPAQRKPLLQFFTGLVDKCDAYKPGKVRVLLLSHDIADYKQLKSESATFMQLNPDTIRKDIKKFVAKKAEELQQELRLTDEELQHVQELTVARSDGMFLFASLVMNNLLKQPTIECLKEQLQPDVFPQNLREAYGNIINRLRHSLGENQWLMSKKIFGWLACARRPLHWHEIQAALSMVTNVADRPVSMDYHNKQLRHDIREVCGSLVQKLGNRIMFVHSTAKLYIVDTEHLDMKLIECEFTTTCLRYLSSSCFQSDLSEDQRERYTLQGYYSFQDYALAKWVYHIDAVIKAGSIPRDCLSNFSQALAEFAQVYHSQLSIPADAEERTSRARGECSAFVDYAFYETLVTIWTHFSHQQAANSKERNKVSLPSLKTSLEQSRAMLESLSSRQGLEELYGECLFKCDRLTCAYFYEGFESKEARDNHLRRHDRPYPCPVQGCSVVSFGFSTNKDREKHIRMYHPDEASGSTFARLPRELVEDARFSCPDCKQTFTRKANRDAHVRSHYDERPFVCDVCPNKAFVRSNDLRRHVRDIHSRRIA
ncbi:hypothetical protein F5B21DRAFT_489170 [Xylaria acuta]|nr:hypothetical protein F5B21DRAFT_489170 [Xylaria acuta]